jgi:hypothetical protein
VCDIGYHAEPAGPDEGGCHQVAADELRRFPVAAVVDAQALQRAIVGIAGDAGDGDDMISLSVLSGSTEVSRRASMWSGRPAALPPAPALFGQIQHHDLEGWPAWVVQGYGQVRPECIRPFRNKNI